jgi:hypothetical protein
LPFPYDERIDWREFVVDTPSGDLAQETADGSPIEWHTSPSTKALVCNEDILTHLFLVSEKFLGEQLRFPRHLLYLLASSRT